MDIIVLAGGLGTRLKPITENLPKPMVTIAGKPFLTYIFDYLIAQDISQKIIISVGYQYDKITNYFGEKYENCELMYSIEHEPLGTGGAIQYALNKTESEDVLILNGDTFFDVSLKDMISFHRLQESDLTVALKYLKDFDRYNRVLLADSKILKFEEKQYNLDGNINGGIYILKKKILQELNFAAKFSFEDDFLKRYFDKIKCHGFIADGYFIDIGIVQDYERGQVELPLIFEERGL